MNDRDPRRGSGRHGRDRDDDGLTLLCRNDDGCLHEVGHGEEEESVLLTQRDRRGIF